MVGFVGFERLWWVVGVEGLWLVWGPCCREVGGGDGGG